MRHDPDRPDDDLRAGEPQECHNDGLGVVMRGLSGASGARQIAARLTTFLSGGLGPTAAALVARTGKQERGESG